MTSAHPSKPRYVELGDLLKTSIEKGEYPVGSLLPTERELCERFQVSRHTARAALAQLITAGLVQRRAGAGTRVIARNTAMRYEHAIDSVESLLQYGNSTRLQVLEATRHSADPSRAKLLEIRTGQSYLQLQCIRRENLSRQPIAMTGILVPVRAGVPAAQLLDLTTCARALARFIHPLKLSRVTQNFDASTFEADQAKLLGVSKMDPAMRIQRIYRDQQDRLLMYAVSLHPPGRFAYSIALSRDR